MARLDFRPSSILLYGDDYDAQLVYIEGRLAAVVTRLTAEAYDEDLQGSWHLEAGFGPCGSHSGAPFRTLDEVRDWALAAFAANCQDSWTPAVRLVA
jgi:hypothetical protein